MAAANAGYVMYQYVKKAAWANSHQKLVYNVTKVATTPVMKEAGTTSLKKPLGTAPMVSPRYQYFEAGTS